MRFHRVLDALLGQGSRVALLRALVMMSGEHTGRELARLVRIDPKACHVALQALADSGVVRMRRVGRAIAYSLNEHHAVVETMLRPLFEREQQLLESFAEDLGARLLVRPESIVVFGSVARGEEELRSDIDVLIVVREGRQVEPARAAAAAAVPALVERYGAVPQVLVEEVGRFRSRVRRGDPLRREIVRTGKVVKGRTLAEILSHGAETDANATRRPK